MQEVFESGLLIVVAALAAILQLIGARPNSGMTKKQKTMLWRILAAALLLLVLQAAGPALFDGLGPAGRWVRLACYLVDYAVIGHDILKKAFKGIRNGQVFDENFLMAVATLGALALAVYENGDYLEAIAVMLFYQVGEWFQSYAVGRSRRNISELMDIRPDYANIEQNGKLEQVDPDEVAIGTFIVVQPGEKVPIDGTVVEGVSTLNTAALTGESLPREVKTGDEIISGCINMTGLLKIQTTKEFGESTVSKILDLVENASSRKSRSEDFISKFARIYTPAVCGSAVVLAVLPPLVRMFGLGLDAGWETWIYRALTFLVASCPCALVISIPLSFFAGIGGASNAGVLVKGSNYLETLSQARIVVFDKTGTLTQGVFEVNGIHHSQLENEKLVEYAALAESASSHPISKSLQRAYGREIDRSRVSDIQELSGNGVTAVVDGHAVAAGNDKLMDRLGIPYIPCRSVGTIIHMAIDGKYAGHIVISDVVKPNARAAIQALKAAGVRRTVMLTGDAARVADHVAVELGIDQVCSQLLPAGKVEKVEELLRSKGPKEKLAFVGDGINDAPVLSRADIGIAMGAMGSDAAIEAADVVLMDDDPMKIAKAIKISRKCLGIVYQNIVFAIGVKLLCLVLVALGLANMWLAVFADVGVMILAVLNAIRALFVKNL
ncbi:MAG TPA: cadmium-translocating P-type ATPase [Candidatus Oscillibacter excrementigallinarum]|uniref:Cd(2+)-exporting ATPase n=1 Tax=Candidatus Oscillibacter excrementigallinarum TaxID=2838716 RepID=A0A9D2LHS7_9FIRM|nr:cadmium-translocating P-type ATPase [Candidatus Oscillibacter excrementigallinarum]